MNPPQWPHPRVIVHKGGGHLAPENTLFGIDIACKHSIFAVEFDTMLSADEIPMLMHDDELTRTAVDPKYAGKMMNSYHAEDLKTVDVGSYFDPNLKNVCIPSLEEVILFCIEKKVFMNIEIKPAKGHDLRTGVVIAELVSKYLEKLQENGVAPLFSSFSIEALQAAKVANSTINRGLIFDKTPQLEYPDTWKELLKELGVISVHVNASYLSEDQVRELTSLGYAVMCYTVNSLSQADELLSWGVSCLCTDKADLFSDLSRKLEKSCCVLKKPELNDDRGDDDRSTDSMTTSQTSNSASTSSMY